MFFLVTALHCPALPEVPNGMINSRETSYQSLVNISCHTGHQMGGEQQIQTVCEADGRWSVTPSQCLRESKATQQAQNSCTTFIQCWNNVENGGPTLCKWCTNVLCLLGEDGQQMLVMLSGVGEGVPKLNHHQFNLSCLLANPGNHGNEHKSITKVNIIPIISLHRKKNH